MQDSLDGSSRLGMIFSTVIDDDHLTWRVATASTVNRTSAVPYTSSMRSPVNWMERLWS